MKHLIRSLPLVLLMASAAPGHAQDAEGDEEPVPNPMELNMGEDAAEEGDGPGSIYVRSEHDDWQIRCFRASEGEDPCQLYQLLTDPNGNPVSEINVFPVAGDGTDAAAGATVVTPLETLLTAQLELQVDSGGVKRYPFAWCSEIGCFARLGFNQDDVLSFKKGNVARISIRPVQAPDQKVTLTVSLKGFTAAFEEAEGLLPE